MGIDAKLKPLLIHGGISILGVIVFTFIRVDGIDHDIARRMFLLYVPVIIFTTCLYIAMSVKFLRFENSKDVFHGTSIILGLSLILGLLSYFLGDQGIGRMITDVYQVFNGGYSLIFYLIPEMSLFVVLLVALTPGLLIFLSTGLDDW